MSTNLHFQTDLFRHGHQSNAFGEELVVDNFAGGGGASTGIAHAIGRSVDIAINHDLEAIRLHQKNHPETKHYCENILQVDPIEVCEGRPVGMAWFSPDCTHHSNALGGKPRKKEIRALAWIVLRWAAKVRPRVIFLENVKEFEQWGPLKNGRRVRSRMGETFQRWVRQLRDLGYTVEWRRLSACDYGAPTIRERLFLVARCDGQPITWPKPTHGKGRKPYRTAAECIDWSLPCPSIFLTKEEAKALGVIRPLSENTMRRIAKGLKRYVLDNPQPFIVAYHTQDSFRGQPVTEPLRTQTTENRFGLVSPYMVGIDNKSSGDSATWSAEDPLRTITTENRFAMLSPFMMATSHTKSTGRSNHCNEPEAPLRTITGINDKAVIAPCLVQTGYGEREGQAPRALDIHAPLGTVVAGGSKHALCAAWLAKHYGGVTGHGVEQPLGTVTTVDHHSLVSAFLTKFFGTSHGADANKPLPTITASGNHIGEVRAFLCKYYGQGDGQPIDEPVHTVTTKDRFGLVTVAGTEYQIVDIGLRMLQPRELARAQGMPDNYILEGTKTAQVAMIGNSVCPPVAEALVRANYQPQIAAMKETA